MSMLTRPTRTKAQVAAANLHSAKAALVTAKQRFMDAENRFAESLDCSTDFIDSGSARCDLAWWRQQLECAERAVEELEKGLK